MADDDLSARFDADQMRTASKALKAMDDKASMSALRKGLRAAAAPVLAEAKDNVAAVSATVAKAIVLQTKFTARQAGVYVVAKRNKMPKGHEALPGLLEKGSKGNSREIRHPLFGDREIWYAESVHPFLQPALEKNRAAVTENVRQAVEQALRAAGL